MGELKEKAFTEGVETTAIQEKEKGYNPISQFVGYVMSGDPTYITSHNNARALIMKLERDELVEELFKEYLKDE